MSSGSLPSPGPGTRVLVGLSGGVDSAVAALLLKQAGWDVQGLYMSNWEEDDDGYCTAAQDFQDARAIAGELGIPLHRVSFAAQYRRQVFAYFLAEHEAGRTPNPDVLCNREIKFGVALDWARRLGATHLATGHYARLLPTPDGVGLFKALDAAKDQSYFLSQVARTALTQVLMPLGELCKGDVRALARRAGLPVHDKPDSTGICFIGERPFRDFLARYLVRNPGPIESDDGERLGEHEGLAFYTLGQRAGLQIGGRHGRPEAPWYVAAKDAARNTLVVVQGQEHPQLFSASLESGDWHWLAAARAGSWAAGVKVRYRQADQEAQLLSTPHGTMQVRFERAQRAVTPGQYVVAYEAERCLGGAVIERTLPAMARASAA
ncbi:MAG TPA: tRNA 2-thiouridine(34) synthase MnmA [Steroidobacteraceae bacterium]|nr:tRNA 2-thiouridine(34) synthase MnmA [Steroidobacteraceae bacterium]